MRECQKCKVPAEEKERGCLFLLCVVLFFPLGLLLLLVPKRQVCPKCEFEV